RMHRVAAVMTAQIAVESGADVVQLVKQRYELAVEVLLQESRQTEGEHVEELGVAVQEALNLIEGAAARALQVAAGEAQRRDARLQAVAVPAARLRDGEQHATRVDMAQRLAAHGDVGGEAADIVAEVEGRFGRAGGPVAGRRSRAAAGAAQQAYGQR